MANATKSLAPLDPALAAHLIASLGPPQPYEVSRDGGLDIVVAGGWTIALAQIGSGGGDPSTSPKGTDVEIILTEKGRLIPTRRTWSRTPDGFSIVEQRSGIFATFQQIYDFLVEDGKGRLGPASKAAWVQACRNVPGFADLQFERVD